MFDTKEYEQRMDATVNHFEEELRKVRTGRAHPNMLDTLKIEAYGTQMPINQVANVTVAEAQQLLVTPFDPGQIAAITAAIRADQTLGLNPSDDGRVIRVPIPPLTEERRRQIAKQTGEKVEQAKVQLRGIRQDAIKAAKAKKDAKELSEDDLKAVENGIDDDIKTYQAKIDEMFKAKEQEILTI